MRGRDTRTCVPTIIDHGVLEAVVRSEVDKRLDALRAAYRYQLAPDLAPTQPIRRRLAGFDPARVLDPRRGRESVDEVGLAELARLVSKHDHSPWRLDGLAGSGASCETRIADQRRERRMHS